ncbi:MAG: hypothetical protein IKB79_02425 [Oscillospiraceae bacterium]|nr:hypothetical protein [Oscillospiraceae bacterium]
MENEEKRQEENRRAIRWAERAGIMAAADSQRVVTYGELAGILYRTLEYFFKQLIAVVEER